MAKKEKEDQEKVRLEHQRLMEQQQAKLEEVRSGRTAAVGAERCVFRARIVSIGMCRCDAMRGDYISRSVPISRTPLSM